MHQLSDVTIASSLTIIALRVILAAVFAVAGFAKLRNAASTAEMLAGFSVPPRFVKLASYVLPLSELAAATLLVPAPTARTGAALTAALLVVFTAAMIVNLVLGRKIQCRCFGQAAASEISSRTVARNTVLLTAALIIAATATPLQDAIALAWIESNLMPVTVATVLAAAYGVLAFLLYQILQQQGRILLRLEPSAVGGAAVAPREDTAPSPSWLPIGSKAPDFILKDLDARAHALVGPVRETPRLLLFAHPHCGPCRLLLPELSAWRADFAGNVDIVVVSEGAIHENREVMRKVEADLVVLQEQREVAEAYRIYGTPGAVLVDRVGAIASHAAMGADAIRDLVYEIRTSFQPSMPVLDMPA